MKLIIAGSRNLNLSVKDIADIVYAHRISITEIVSGKARGIDTCGENYALASGHPVTPFPADWETHGNAAGPIRNKQMADYADALLLIWDGKSKGSNNMKDQMVKLKKTIYEVIVKPNAIEPIKGYWPGSEDI